MFLLLGTKTLEDHSQTPKRLTNAAFRQFYGAQGMSAPSLHRETLIWKVSQKFVIMYIIEADPVVIVKMA